MILIKTKIGQSGVHGIGLFADQFIPKGTVTWKYNPDFDMAFSEDDLNKMSESSRKQVLHYAYFDFEQKKYILCFDDQRFINHSQNPSMINIESTPDYDVAARDINQGEELLCNYNLFDPEYFKRVNIDESLLV